MAIYHLNAKWHTRKKDTKLRALRAYAYRAGARVFDPLNNRVYNSTNKKEVVHVETVGPPNAAAWMLDPLALWAHIEQRENRSDSVLFAEWEGALPNELGLDECKAIVSGFVSEFMLAEGQVTSWALHDKSGNRHFHAMCTTRDIEGDGFGKKNNRWRQWAMLYKTREGLAKHINMALEKAGLPQRVTHKSYADLGIDREPTQHVGPEYSGNRHAAYRAKRDERLRNNRRVKVVNQQRGKRRSAAARKCLVAGAQGAKLMTVVRDQLNEARQLDAVPVTPAMSAEEVAAYNYLHTALPEADAIYLFVGRFRTGLGREWNWPTMAAQYKRLDKPGGDVLTALLVKELIWVVSRSPEQAPEFAKLVPRTRLADIAVAAKAWAQEASKPDALNLIDSILQTTGIGVSDGSGIQTGVSTGNPATLDFSNYADALAPLAYLIADMNELVGGPGEPARWRCRRVPMPRRRPWPRRVPPARLPAAPRLQRPGGHAGDMRGSAPPRHSASGSWNAGWRRAGPRAWRWTRFRGRMAPPGAWDCRCAHRTWPLRAPAGQSAAGPRPPHPRVERRGRSPGGPAAEPARGFLPAGECTWATPARPFSTGRADQSAPGPLLHRRGCRRAGCGKRWARRWRALVGFVGQFSG